VADREVRKAAALNALLDDTGTSYRQLQIAEPDDNSFQLSDYPDIPSPVTYRIARSISAIEKQALPFKIRVTWKYPSGTVLPASQELARMDEMEDLILPAVKDKGLAKWVCTVTGEHRREWIFYTRSDDAFITRVQAALAPTGPYPIELSGRKEPAWGADGLNGDNQRREFRITPKQCVE
jgi:hypothetical protein